MIPINGADDRPSTEELFHRAVKEARSDTEDGDAYWAAIKPLQSREPTAVWALVAPLAHDANPDLRALVPDVLRYLGGQPQPLLDKTLALFREMLAVAQAPEVLSAIADAFVDLDDPSSVDLLRPYVEHSDASVRKSVVYGLLPFAHLAIPELVRLSEDESDDVRNWATFGLGSQLGDRETADIVDTPEIREALVKRLLDKHAETRAEAALGLAKRGDVRAIPVVQMELEAGSEWDHYEEAAALLGLS
jgi:HEAT repeat protein